MNNFIVNVVTIMVTAFFLGCSLDFSGEDVNLVTPNITSKELEIVSQRTRIIFPEGSTGLGYFSKDQASTMQ